jgi:tRNA U38,U39,U40 pseudouridine synthase TruA
MGNGGGKTGMDISISGGNPPSNNGVSGLGGSPKITASVPRTLITRPDPHTKLEDAPERTGPPNFANLPAGAQPEQVFASKKVYKMLVNMPNLSSATGSWILNFSELRVNADAPRISSSDISAPVPLRKVDPKYPPSLMSERVEGEVVLYAVIRRDGTVNSIQLVHGIDEQLDENAMQQAAAFVIGEHDFTSFAAVDPERGKEADGVSNVRRISASSWERSGEELIYTVRGSGFLHHMVRNLVGTFVLVGKGTLRPEDITRILETKDRSAAGATVPSHGLYLVNVEY